MASLVVGAPALPTMMTPQALNFSSRLSYSQSQIGLSHSASSSLSLSTATLTSLPFVYCGRGDRKTAKGKRFSHSFGNARPKDKKKGRGPPRIPLPSLPPKPDQFDDDEVVKIEIDESPFSG